MATKEQIVLKIRDPNGPQAGIQISGMLSKTWNTITSHLLDPCTANESILWQWLPSGTRVLNKLNAPHNLATCVKYFWAYALLLGKRTGARFVIIIQSMGHQNRLPRTISSYCFQLEVLVLTLSVQSRSLSLSTAFMIYHHTDKESKW